MVMVVVIVVSHANCSIAACHAPQMLIHPKQETYPAPFPHLKPKAIRLEHDRQALNRKRNPSEM